MDRGKIKTLIKQLERGKANVRFPDLKRFIIDLGFESDGCEGSHQIYRKKGEMPISIQPDKRNKSKAKFYQVNQVIKRAKQIIKDI